MKKSLFSLASLVMATGIFGLVNAQREISELFDEGVALSDDAYAKVLNEYEDSWGYDSESTLECTANDGITVVSPIVEDEDFESVKLYRLFISPYRINQLKTSDPSIDTSKIIIKEQTINEGASEVKFNISTSDFDSNTAYYGFILPIDGFDGFGTPSKETCFQLASNICLQDTACDTLDLVIKPVEEVTEKTEQHGAASCVGMDMANVTHTIKGNTLTLKWTAVDGDNVEIAIFDPDSEIYKSLKTVKMSDEKFDYQLQWDGEQNFMLTNGCKDLYYKADAKKSVKEEEKIVTPATGPAENILYIAIAAIVLYGVYSIFTRKSNN